jgi:hypothetical protein
MLNREFNHLKQQLFELLQQKDQQSDSKKSESA